MELLENTATDSMVDANTLALLSGVALVVLGSGLILANPLVRRHLSQIGVGNLLTTVFPDLERDFKLRAM